MLPGEELPSHQRAADQGFVLSLFHPQNLCYLFKIIKPFHFLL